MARKPKTPHVVVSKQPKQEPAQVGTLTTSTAGEQNSVVAATQPRTALSTHVQYAASNFEINDRGKNEIIQNQLAQFCEILSVRLRQRLLEIKMKLLQIDPSRAEKPTANTNATSNGIAKSISVSSWGVFWLLQEVAAMDKRSAAANASLVVGTWLLTRQVGPRTIGILIGGGIALRATSALVRRQQIQRCENVITAFSPGGEDEVETERAIRSLTVQIGMRYLDQAARLSKTGQRVLCGVIVDRIVSHLARRSIGVVGESRSPILGAMQHLFWDVAQAWRRLVSPGDQIEDAQTVPFIQRCIRAVSTEFKDRHLLQLQLSAMFKPPPGQNSQGAWTAHGVLSLTGIRVVRDDQTGIDSFSHRNSQVAKYGYCYGTREEALERSMTLEKESSESHDAGTSMFSKSLMGDESKL